MLRSTREVLILGLLSGAVAWACSSGGDAREPSSGSEFNTGLPSGDDGGTNGSGNGGSNSNDDSGTGTDTSGGSLGSGNGSVGSDDGGIDNSPGGGASERTLEECSTEKKAWLPVIEGGAKPADCGEALVSWCCSTEQAKKVYPTMAVELEKRFQQNIVIDGYKLYHCSSSSNTKTSFHFARIEENGARKYRSVFISDIFPSNVDNGMATCAPQLTTSDLIVGTGTGTGTSSLNFTTDIKPVLEARCSGTGCHSDSGALPAADKFIDSEAKFKASDKERIRDNTMPPSGSAALNATEKAKLLEFLGG